MIRRLIFYSHLALLMLCVSCISGTGLGSYNYGVMIENKGANLIFLSDFGISGTGGDDMVAVGTCAPGKSAGMSPFVKKPLNEVIIEWKNMKTGEMSRAKVQIKLPKKFKQTNASEIDFIVFPDEGRVDVMYEVWDSAKGDYVKIRGDD